MLSGLPRGFKRKKLPITNDQIIKKTIKDVFKGQLTPPRHGGVIKPPIFMSALGFNLLVMDNFPLLNPLGRLESICYF